MENIYQKTLNYILEYYLLEIFSIRKMKENKFLYRLTDGTPNILEVIVIPGTMRNVYNLFGINKEKYDKMNSVTELVKLLYDSPIISLEELRVTKLYNYNSPTLDSTVVKPLLFQLFKRKNEYLAIFKEKDKFLPENPVLIIRIIDNYFNSNILDKLRNKLIYTT